MALKIYEKFAPRANLGDTNYPNGSIKNESAPGAKDGTPLDADWGNDYAGFDAALLSEAGITPSGTPDTVLNSQRLSAMTSLFKNIKTLDEAVNNGEAVTGSYVLIPELGNAIFKYTDTQGTGEYTINVNGGGYLTLVPDGTGWAKTQWFGMKFDANYADYLSTGNTSASTSEHEEWQTCADWCRAKKQNMLMQEGTVLLDGPSRVYLWPSTGETVTCKGQGKGKTNIFNTIQNSTGDLLVNIPVGGQNSDMPGLNIWEDFTILESGRGDLNGTNGVNAIAGAFAEGVIVRNVDIKKAGNRAVNVEGLGSLVHYELDNVNIKDAWKNGFTAGGFSNSLPCRMILNNVEVDGWNLIANEPGGLTNENIGGNITSATEDITQYITGYLRFKNGYCQAFRNLSTPIHGSGEISAKNVTITDFSSVTKSAVIYIGRVGDQVIPRIDVDGVVDGGGVLTRDDTGASVTLNGIRVRNTETFDLWVRCYVNLIDPDFNRRGESIVNPSFILGFASTDTSNGLITGGSIIAEKPFGNSSGDFINSGTSGYDINACTVIETGSTGGDTFFSETDFSDLRKTWGNNNLPNDWVLKASFLSTFRESGGLRVRSYLTNNSEFIQLNTKVNSSSGLYTIRFKLSGGDSVPIRLYASHGAVNDDVITTVTTSTSEVVVTGYQFTGDNVIFRIGRTDSLAGGMNKVIEYLKIESE